jgi:ATP phosphoribosyltransferase regulatory subunit
LCYIGSVVHGVTGHLEKSRNPIQVGAELYGHAGERATIEVVELMLETLALAEVDQVHLDLGHVGVYRALTADLQLSESDEAQLFDILQRKDPTDLDLFLVKLSIDAALGGMIRELLALNGPISVLESARVQLSAGGAAIAKALHEVSVIADALKARHPQLPIHIDLAELRGYHYHTGIVFAAYVPGQGREIARGGRYDEIGQAFGHARPAVGFSADLKVLDALSVTAVSDTHLPIFAPADQDAALDAMMTALRNQGRIVIQSLGGPEETPQSLGCGQSLIQRDGRWQLL